jgi:hypothetical protein
MTSRSFASLAAGLSIAVMAAVPIRGQGLPTPSLKNSTIISIEHDPRDTGAVEYIKSTIPFGPYTWLSFSVTHYDPSLAWNSDWSQADTGIQSYKDLANALIAASKAAGVRCHLVFCSGLARGLWVYNEAKREDVRNAQWYNDNNIASNTQIATPGYMDNYVFGTFSRYALKMRRNLAAKSKATMDFLKKRMDEEPNVLVAVSGWGEAEMNFNRMGSGTYPDFFCDYSPFAVLEFRDWIKNEGMYGPNAVSNPGGGYTAGGARYQGANGLANFNADFGTDFSSWDLKYYNWSLGDGEGGAIPIGEYVQGGMMPTSGARYIAGGFDPPRQMVPGNRFWDLWNLFRETMVRNLLLDLGYWADKAGIDPDRWYSHQIPADYLFGTRPAIEPKNTRYYSSASPFWTADVRPFGSIGATIYDVKFPGWFARTSEYLPAAAAALGGRWAVMEYDAEVYPQGLGVGPSSSDYILNQYLRVFSQGPSLINFWRWTDTTGESQIRGTSKETALREFVRRIGGTPRTAVSDASLWPPLPFLNEAVVRRDR